MTYAAETVESLVCPDLGFAEKECLWITPGLFDLQINGIAGTSFTDPELAPEKLEMADALIRSGGVSRYCPTVISCAPQTARAVLSTFRRAWEAGSLCGAWAIHLEGPWISDEDGVRGVHRKEFVREVSLTEWDAMQEAAGGRIRLLTLAPERHGALPLVECAARAGTVVSLGHTSASPEQITAAVRAGARMSTHLFNGCAPVLDRHTNVVFSQLSEDALYGCFIADGHHVPSATLRIGIRAKGVSKSVLVSDLAHLSGLPDGEYEMEGNRVEIRQGGLHVKGSRLLSGAVRTLREDVELLGREAEPGIEAALLMATRSPAAAVGELSWADLRPGRKGPVAVFFWDGAHLRLEHRLGF
jgi:N-acetylglucosamine-6-phosphate deacetylase